MGCEDVEVNIGWNKQLILLVLPSVIPATVFIRLVDKLEEWSSPAGT
jgi:hypothetical protein